MDANQHQRVMQILAEAIEQEPNQRDTWVAGACAGDELLRKEVVRLMAHQESAPDFLEESPFAAAMQIDPEPVIGNRIGPYKIIRELGSGGMGAVYLAERDDREFAKRSAIKVIKRGMDADFVLQRFRNERQILANLDHPNIARLLDGGTTSDGLPYFIMEYVEGQPISEYADTHRLTTTERLKLFRTVCSAVLYAHQHLVIHRDIKPSNILVTEAGEPKLLDFGIAKLLQPDSAEDAELTATAVQVMTPEYASPEQIKGERITTSSDVYTLGVLLYELLTGLRPYRLNSRSAGEVAKAICQQQPEKPSQAVTGQQLVASDKQRSGGQPPTGNGQNAIPQSTIRNPKLLRGDLDNIVLKALRKEPQRRYASVEQFSDDIRRHLEGLPVIACKDTLSYRASKFIQRNKIGVAAAAIILLVLLSGITATTWQAHRASLESARAQQRFDQVRKLAHSVMFDYHDEIAALPGSTKLRERLVEDSLGYLDSLAQESNDDPSLLREIGSAYQKVGEIQGGSSISAKGGALTFSNLGNTQGAFASFRHALAVREKLASLDPSNKEFQEEYAINLLRLGELSLTLGKPGDTVKYNRQALLIYESLVAADPSNKARTAKYYSIYFVIGKAMGVPTVPSLGDARGALENLSRATRGWEALVAENPTLRQGIAAMYQNIALVQLADGNPAEALQSLRKAEALDEAVVKENPLNTVYRRELAILYGTIGITSLALNDSKEALKDCRQAVAIFESLVAADPDDASIRRDSAVGYRNLAAALAKNNYTSEARANFKRALKIFQELAASDPNNALVSYQESQTCLRFSTCLSETGDVPNALEKASEATRITEALLATSSDNQSAQNILAQSYLQLGKCQALVASKASIDKRADEWREARRWFQKSLDTFRDMKNKGKLSGIDASKPDEVAREVAKCTAVVADSNSNRK